MFLGTLFITAGFIFMNLLGKPTSGSSTLMLLRRRCGVTGSNTEVTLHIPSTRGLFFGRLNESLGQNHLPCGIEDSSNDIPNWANLWGWIRSMHKLLIVQQSMSTLYNLAQSSMKNKFHRKMFIIWMKRGVSKEWAGECKPLNTLFHVIGNLNTSFRVQIWSSSLSSSVLVQTARASNLVSSFLEKSSTQSGLKWTMGSGV
jgi:hypothetical protein